MINLRRNALLALSLFALTIAFGDTTAAAAPLAATATLAVTSGTTAVSAVVSGTVVTLTATVKSGTTLVTPGLVSFCDADLNAYCLGSALLGQAQLTSKGIATLRVRLALGVHSISAVFSGTNKFAKAVSTAKGLEVQGAAGSVTTLATAPTDATGSYELSTTVSSVGGGALAYPPTGPVTFPDASNAGKSLGTATLAPGSGGYGLSFADAAQYTTFGNLLAVEDVNGDGYPDEVVTLTTYLTNLAFVVQGGPGGFSTATTLPSLPVNFYYSSLPLVADFNGDGFPDLLMYVEDLNPSMGIQTYTPQMFLGSGNGTFTAGSSIAPEANCYLNNNDIVLSGDFNGDGITDLIINQYCSNVPSAVFYAGKGDGMFLAPVNLGALPTEAVGDFNGDGKLDLVGIPSQNGIIQVALGNGDGSFQAPVSSPGIGYEAQVVVADFNGDGKLDVASNDGAYVYIFLGNGDGSFRAPSLVPLSADSAANYLVVADWNGDGMPDLFVPNYASDAGDFLLNNGDGTFRSLPPVILSEYGNTSNEAFFTADMNGDGLPDFTVWAGEPMTLLNTGGWVSQAVLPSVTLSAGSGKHEVKASYGGDSGTAASSSAESAPLWAARIATTLTVASSAATISPGGIVTLTAKLTPNSGAGHSNNYEPIGFYSGATLVGTGSLLNGAASLTTTALPSGTHAVTAVYAGDNSFAGATSTAVTVTVTQIATQLTLATSTSSTTADSNAETLTATLSPSSSSTLTTTGESVTFLSGTTTLGSATLAAGVAKLAGVELPAGSDSITAVYGGDTHFAAATSAAHVVTVAKEATTVKLTSSSATVPEGSQITLTAVLAPTTPGSYSNFGVSVNEPVWFYSGTELLGFGYSNNYTSTTATATFYVTLPTGTNKITAVYKGDSSFVGSTSAVVTVTVTGGGSAKAPVMSWAEPEPIKVGTALTGKQLNATSSVAGTMVYWPAGGALLSRGKHTLTATFTPSAASAKLGYTSAREELPLTVE